MQSLEEFKVESFLQRVASINDPSYAQNSNTNSKEVTHNHYHRDYGFRPSYWGSHYQSCPNTTRCNSSPKTTNEKKKDKSSLISTIGIIGILGTIAFIFCKIGDYFRSRTNYSNTEEIEAFSQKRKSKFFQDLSKLVKSQKILDGKRKKRDSLTALASTGSIASCSSLALGGFTENDDLIKYGAIGVVASIGLGILNYFLSKGDLVKQEIQQAYNSKVANNLLNELEKSANLLLPKQESIENPEKTQELQPAK